MARLGSFAERLASEEAWELVPVQEDRDTMLIFSIPQAEAIINLAKDEGVPILPDEIIRAMFRQVNVMARLLVDRSRDFASGLLDNRYGVDVASARCLILNQAIKEAIGLARQQLNRH